MATHAASIWVLLQDRQTDAQLSTVAMLRRLGARLSALLDARSLVVHDATCWSVAKWDAETTGFATQLWQILPASGTDEGQLSNAPPLIIPPLLGSWEARRYDFYWRDGPLPEPLRLHQEHQQDALRHSWTGHIAGTDGGVKWHDERMSAGYVVGADPVPVEVLAVRVGGPLSTLRAEAAGLLQLLACLSEKQQAPLLVFIDSLVLLDILGSVGESDG